MKKIFSVILALAMMLTAASALAAGKISVDQENLVVTEGYTTYGYVYAKISNVGDKPVKVNAGVLELYDPNGDVITSSDWLNTYAEYLEPGEYTYAYIYDDVEDTYAPDDIADYLLTVTGKSDTDRSTLRLPVEVDYQENVGDGYWTYDYMYATVTNNTDQPIYDITTVLVLLDADGNILYMTSDSMYSKAIMPGSSIVIREYVPDNYKDAYTKAGLTPAAVDAIAFINVDN